MRVQYGPIVPGNQVIKNAIFRDMLNDERGGNVRCVEMEPVGIANNFPYLVIRRVRSADRAEIEQFV
jgi:hypothetical protein